MHPLEHYIRELREIRSSGEAVPETSYYGALAELLNQDANYSAIKQSTYILPAK